ncbi:MAG: hypothetical protein GXO88_00540 [Chlorobi bacterium]|nr:hypothetical protein [Chlorobiota bacterium]
MKNIILILFYFPGILLYPQNTFEKHYTINSLSISSAVLQLSDESYVLVGSDRKPAPSIDKDVLLLKLNKT